MASRTSADGRTGRLKSWKEIAAFFGANERTVKRWERERGLPVRRLPGRAKATVFADVGELERWLQSAGPTARGTAGRARRRTPLFLLGGMGALALAGAGAVLLRPEPPPAAHQPRPEVVDLVLAARYNFERRTPESLTRAARLYRDAILRDPAYAEGYVGLANSWLLLREYAGLPDAEAYPRARAAAERALALDPGSAEAQIALAFVTFYWTRDFDAGLGQFERAIRLDPRSARAHHWYATALYHAGRIPEALVQINAAQALDPESHAILADKGLILSHAGRIDEASALLGQMEEADPAYLSPHAYLALIHLAREEWPAYLREAALAARLRRDADGAAVIAAGARGLASGGRAGLLTAMAAEQRRQRAEGGGSALELAATLAMAGDRDGALRELGEAVSRRDPGAVSLRVDPRLRSLHGDPAFEALAGAIGRPA